jgi:CDP-glycerol glycerophosphotransferase (TagB/SpsB family)
LIERSRQIIKSCLRETIGFLLYWVSCLFPRNKYIAVFGSRWGYSYSDNSKYLFEYMNEHSERMKCVWITRDKNVCEKIKSRGYRAYMEKSMLGIWYCLRAKIVVSSYHPYMDVQGFGIGGARIVQLFHGTPLKKINYDDIYASAKLRTGFINKLKLSLFPYKNPNRADILITASENEDAVNNLTTAFGIRKENIKITGLPRNDILAGNKKECSLFIAGIRKKFNLPRIIAYLPTFQHGGDGKPKMYIDDLVSAFDLINERLRSLNAVLILRLHPVLWDALGQMEGKEYLDPETHIILINNQASRIIKGHSEGLEDFYPILRDVDILITDYSSVYFDYLLLKRPVIFAQFDKGNMFRRGLYYEYDEVTPGPKAKSWEEIFNYVESLVREPGLYGEERVAIQNKFNKYNDSNSCERVYNEIRKLVCL